MVHGHSLQIIMGVTPPLSLTSQTQMQPEEPGHYGKLDHGGKKTSTLPVVVTGSSEYGKLDRVCYCS